MSQDPIAPSTSSPPSSPLPPKASSGAEPDAAKPTEEAPRARPLDGLRVLEMGQLMAGPFTGTMLGYFGAEVIKIEPPEGDPVRGLRVLDDDGTSLWWRSIGRNKKCVTLDLRREAGRALARSLAGLCDVVVENFRPGTLERWGMAPDVLREQNPGLIVARVSGYGQTGPNAAKPGYASVCEGFGGLRHVTGMPGEPTVRANLSLGDSLSGMQATLGVLLALWERRRSGRGQDIDLGIFEAVFGMMEATVPEYDRRGVVREASGTTITGIVPSNTFTCRDGKSVIIGGNGDSIYRRLMRAAGRPDLASDPRLATNEGRVRHQAEIDSALAAWCAQLDAVAVLDALEEAAVPAGPIYSVVDMMADPHYRARGLFETVDAGGRPLALPAIPPRLSATPGHTTWAGPELGAHNQEVFGDLLGLDADVLEGLRRDGVI